VTGLLRRAPATAAALGVAVCLLAVPADAAAQDAAREVDVSALPLDLERVHRGLQRSSEEFSEEDGRLNLAVVVNVFGQAPPLNFLPSGPNVFTGPPADGPPTHADMMRVNTPRYLQTPVMDFGAAVQWLRDAVRSRGPQPRR
jgi:NAD(P)-dependent dehydrogenase (short-subunit alcohol dehydrogenase family)